MEEQKTEQRGEKRKKVRWEYVFEPVNKPTYWDHVALSTEGVVEEKRKLSPQQPRNGKAKAAQG
jgi:hypothetical protein